VSSIGKIRKLSKGTLFTVFLLTSLSSSIAFADDWSLKDKEGVRYTLSGLKNKWVLVNFWAPWCPPCIAELPELVSLQKQHSDLLVIGVAVQYEKKQEVLDVATIKSVSYPIVFGNEDTAADFGGLMGLPTSILYSPAGNLVGHHDGPLTQNKIEQVFMHKVDAATLFTQ